MSGIPGTPSAFQPLIVNVALTGMVAGPDRVPRLPVTTDQIAEDAWLCHQVGAAIVHVHARDERGEPDWRPERYAEIVSAIRERCPELIICASTSGRADPEIERRAAVLGLQGDAKPDMASLTLGSVNFDSGPSVNPAATVELLAERMQAAGIKPELEVFDSGMAAEAQRLLDRGVLAEPLYVNLMLGSHHEAPATARELSHLVDSLPAASVWAGAGIGALQLTANALALFSGGHVRTGLEDNPHLDWSRRETATGNADLVERVVGLAAAAGRRIATAAEAREMLGLPGGSGAGYRIRPAALPADRKGMLSVLATANMHHVPSAEMDDFEVGHWYVAEDDGTILGVAGYRLLPSADGLVGKTTLLAVTPGNRGRGIGQALQELRMALMRGAGAKRVITNADRPPTIDWYQRKFGYRVVGEVKKLHEFGLPDVDHWTTLEAPLR